MEEQQEQESKPMTEIQFLLDLVLNCKPNATIRKKCLERIGEVESKLKPTNQPPILTRAPAHMLPPQALPLPNAAPTVLPMASQRIIGGEVSTGEGLKGPRKF